MRLTWIAIALVALVSHAMAADRWHRSPDDPGQDLYTDKGVVAATVREEADGQWTASAGKTLGSEEWVSLGHFKLMRDAKKAAEAKTHTPSDDTD